MASISSIASAEDLARPGGFTGSDVGTTRALSSAVSWGAIAAGAAAAASLSLILLILGVGLGLSSVSPWAREGVSATTFGVSTILWLTLTQLLASAMGGYLAGRLRTRWTDASTDEVYFRDTAHGFLAWAVASLSTAALLTSVIGSILSGGVASTASMAQGSSGEPMAYFIDSLFRRDAGATTPTAAGAGAAGSLVITDLTEVSRIFANASGRTLLPPEDIRYLGQIVSQRTGLSQKDAEKRVADVYAKVRGVEVAAHEAADKTRKASAYSALWLFVSLLVGAFVASLAATFGGRCRDA